MVNIIDTPKPLYYAVTFTLKKIEEDKGIKSRSQNI
ncbi:hypothetical protein M947_11685 [Sulfurimonas hongkongensis]|uniref:Uncharacterized protein n=1 Tax=Sulfurimonas hongkongensis TaxID=1172190 RepID=T0JBT4_9BACT|nr:hypothetical protein M947_11685 [Sulfurimonas hongkongensis]